MQGFELPPESMFDSMCSEIRAEFVTDPANYERVLNVLSRYCGERMYFSRRRVRRIRHVMAATKMINAGMHNRDIVVALVEKFSISAITARKVRDFAFGQVMRERQMKLDL